MEIAIMGYIGIIGLYRGNIRIMENGNYDLLIAIITMAPPH